MKKKFKVHNSLRVMFDAAKGKSTPFVSTEIEIDCVESQVIGEGWYANDVAIVAGWGYVGGNFRWINEGESYRVGAITAPMEISPGLYNFLAA